jgi:hypothetical protein
LVSIERLLSIERRLSSEVREAFLDFEPLVIPRDVPNDCVFLCPRGVDEPLFSGGETPEDDSVETVSTDDASSSTDVRPAAARKPEVVDWEVLIFRGTEGNTLPGSSFRNYKN